MITPTTPTYTNTNSHTQIVAAHGGGGQLTDELVKNHVLPRMGNSVLNELLDAAMLDCPREHQPTLTIDSYVVQPWQFAGDNIGTLAVCGTVNDLAVCGAKPAALALSLIITEGFNTRDLDVVLNAIAHAATEADVRIVTGDTKVIDRHNEPGIYVTTAGLGFTPQSVQLSPNRVQPGDVLLINGPIAEHGLTVMLARQMPEIKSVLKTDAAPLNHLIDSLMTNLGDDLVFMRDPTRSGIAGLTADLAQTSGYHITLNEPDIPVQPAAAHAADLLGLDVLEIANEGKVVAVVRPNRADEALTLMQNDPLGCDACAIGQVEPLRDGICELHTVIGGRRIIQKPYGEQLPRIC